MSAFELGQRVAYSEHLTRVYRSSDQGFYAHGLKLWTSKPHEGFPKNAGGEGVIVGQRTLANGENNYNGYDEPIVFVAKERFTAYLVAFDLRRKPVYVLPEHLTPLEQS